MWSSRICSGNLLLVLILLSGARGQDKNEEFKHELPEGVELVDPKSLGLTDVDLSKFLGNVKVLGGGQVGDTKTQILTVGFEGDENINFNDFTIPGLTDGNKTALPEKDKEIADMAFQKFKEFFQDPQKAKQFEERHKQAAFQKDTEPPKHTSLPQQNNIHVQHSPPSPPHQLRIPMIQKPYTTPRPHFPQVATPRVPHRIQQPPPPPPPPRHFNNPPQNQHQNQPHNPHNLQQQHTFNSQIKSQPPLEFGARIPVSSNIQARPPPPPPQPQQQYHQHQQSQREFEFHRQHEQKQQHRLTVHHQQQGQHFQRPPPPPSQNIDPAHGHQNFQHHRPPPPPLPAPQNQRFRFPTDNPPPQQTHLAPRVPVSPIPSPQFPPRGNAHQHPPPNPTQVSHHVPQPRPPLVQSFVIHPHPQHLPQQNHANHQQSQPPEQGRIVRNQLLQLDRSTPEPAYDGPSKGLTPPPPPQSYQSTATNQVPVHSLAPFNQHLHSPTAAGSATSSIYIHHGPKTANVEQTPFHPQFQPPTRFAKDFTPIPYQSTTTSRPISFEVTPSMPLIPLSTNENAITDPARTLQLRLYQQQKAQASMQQIHTVLPTQAAPTSPTTTPISITTSYPETNFFVSSSTQYDFPGSQQSEQQPSLENNENIIANQVVNNEIFNNNAPFKLQAQQQQHQIHYIHQQPTLSSQQQQQQQFQQIQSSSQPTAFFTNEHRRPPRQGPPPRFQFHVSHELGHGPRFQMNPDPKSLFNSIRRKRGYKRLSNLFNRMFRWDRH